VRLAFAVAAFLEPEILIIDEVLAVGDAEFQKKAIGKMHDISKGEGRTVLFVSHNMAAVQNLCTRGIVLKNGAIDFVGNIEDSILHYLEENKQADNLENLFDRKGNGIVKVKKALVHGKNENSLPQVGRPFTIKIELDNPKKIASSEIRFDLRIDDNLGQRVVWISNFLKKNEKYNDVETISFCMDKLNLNKGSYYVTLYMEVNKQLSDYIQNAFSFEIIEGDFYGSGKQVPIIQSKMLADFNVYYQ
jgi:lipopolysaccharide transport system ATP-binding protein